MRNNKYYVHRILLPDGSAFKFDANRNANQEPQRGVPKRSLANATRFASNTSISQKSDSVNSEFSLNNSTSGAKPTNKREAQLRAEALTLYREAARGVDVAGDSGLSLGEYVYEKTGWYYDDFGNFLVDHEAPVYLGTSTASQRVMKFAGEVDAQNSALRSENEVLRADAEAHKKRAEEVTIAVILSANFAYKNSNCDFQKNKGENEKIFAKTIDFCEIM